MEQRQDTHKSRTKIIRKGVGILFIFTQNSLRLKLIMNRKSTALRIFIYLFTEYSLQNNYFTLCRLIDFR